MNLEQALQDMAHYGFHPGQLIEYAYEDPYSGWDAGEGDWPVGSLWTVEGRVLYALARAMQPRVVVELGTHHGCSATHILEALHRNGGGQLHAVDLATNRDALFEAVPTHLHARLTLHNEDAVRWLDAYGGEIDLLFEDLDHSTETVKAVWQRARQRLSTGGMLITHDATHFLVGAAILKGILESGLPFPRFYPIAPSDCGLAIWKAPGEFVGGYPDTMLTPDGETVPIVDAPPKVKAKRSKTKRETAP